MSARLISSEFRIHHRMARLPTKRDGIAELISLIASECARRDKEKGEKQEGKERSPRMRLIQIKSRVGRNFSRRQSPPAAPLQHDSNDNHQQTEDQRRRQHDVSEDAHVRIGRRGRDFDEEEQRYADEAGEYDRHSD